VALKGATENQLLGHDCRSGWCCRGGLQAHSVGS
jgi:hypothetical protein